VLVISPAITIFLSCVRKFYPNMLSFSFYV